MSDYVELLTHVVACQDIKCEDCRRVVDGAREELARLRRELEEAKHLAMVYSCADHSKHDEDECALCRAEAALDAERQKRCGTCVWQDRGQEVCTNTKSPHYVSHAPADHGCPNWRQWEAPHA